MMRNFMSRMKKRNVMLCALAFPLACATVSVPAAAQTPVMTAAQVKKAPSVLGIRQINPTTVEIRLSDNQTMTLDFYGENIVRIFQDIQGGIVRDPVATPPAQILVDNPRKKVGALTVQDAGGKVTVSTARMQLVMDKSNTHFKLVNLKNGRTVMETTAPVDFGTKRTTLTFAAGADEYFYGGGVQNGRFSHKGKAIAIENTNNWTDGGVASPTPYYWSTAGYGFMWHTFKKGKYDFGADKPGSVTLSHDINYLDVFLMVNDGAVPLLNDFYQLTGNPVLLPKFGFYEGHLNAYNRDYWKETDKGGVQFEDGKSYSESQKDNGGVKESLNGEKNNYQFSARAVIDRYNAADMPLGWVLPNDGYGAGYGQTGTIDGNIQNLKEFGDYARKLGVEIGLWTQSDLHPKEGVEALLQRDIVKEVRDAGVRVLKTDVAWVGAGYSFGLNGVADVAQIMPYYGNDARPFVISLDGWAGTQRYAGIWSGDQTGGEWEYIRFHIPTYIGSGLSGQPNITSDMDGIFGGKNIPVNVRDFQWKTYTPMQLNMDGWGRNPKYPQALGEPATSINRWYLKMKAELMPYAYSIAHEAVDGKPMIRAMFLDYPNDYTLGTATRYQYLYGPSLLVAPIYQNTQADEQGNDIRNGIYLPEGKWIDYFTGDVYEGNTILNNFDTPLWKLPVFVKQGAIIPTTTPHNNPAQVKKDLRIYELYPAGETTFTEYDDDGTTEAYRAGQYAITEIISTVDKKNNVIVTVSPTKGTFDGMVKEKVTEFRLNVTQKPKKVAVKQGKKNVKLAEVSSMDDFNGKENVYFYEAAPDMNRFATAGSEFASVKVIKNPVLHVKVGKVDVTTEATELKVAGYVYEPTDKQLVKTGALMAPAVTITEENTQAYTIQPTWTAGANADFCEIEFNGMLYSRITKGALLFENLVPETTYTFKVRAVNKDGHSDWATVTATTKSNPLEFAIQGITAQTTCKNQGGQNINKLFDFDESNTWHTAWSTKAVPFTITIDLHSVNVLDKLHYLGRIDGGNGYLQEGKIYYSMDKAAWTEAGTFTWERGGEGPKVYTFKGNPQARYIKIDVTKAVGDFGSGAEMYIFKVPGSESYIPGDINLDNKIDENDLTSYMNYTGLRKGDSDFEGYVSKGDINNNGLIDAYDISNVATMLEDGVRQNTIEPVACGEMSATLSKKTCNAGDIVTLTVSGKGLRSVNAFSFAVPYDANMFEYAGIEAVGTKQMINLTYDRLHTNGVKALYPTFVNKGEKPAIEGDTDLVVIKFKAKQKGKVDLKLIDGLLVDKQLGSTKFSVKE